MMWFARWRRSTRAGIVVVKPGLDVCKLTDDLHGAELNSYDESIYRSRPGTAVVSHNPVVSQFEVIPERTSIDYKDLYDV